MLAPGTRKPRGRSVRGHCFRTRGLLNHSHLQEVVTTLEGFLGQAVFVAWELPGASKCAALGCEKNANGRGSVDPSAGNCRSSSKEYSDHPKVLRWWGGITGAAKLSPILFGGLWIATTNVTPRCPVGRPPQFATYTGPFSLRTLPSSASRRPKATYPDHHGSTAD